MIGMTCFFGLGLMASYALFFTEYLTDVYGNLAMVNYPYESTFLAPLPAYPVEAFCTYLNQSFGGPVLIDVSVYRCTLYSRAFFKKN